MRNQGLKGDIFDGVWLTTEQVKNKWKEEWKCAKKIRRDILADCMAYETKLIENNCFHTLKKIYRSKQKSIPSLRKKLDNGTFETS